MEDRYNVECCDFIHIHKDLVEKVIPAMNHPFMKVKL